MKEKRPIYRVMAERYQKAGKKQKSKIFVRKTVGYLRYDTKKEKRETKNYVTFE